MTINDVANIGIYLAGLIWSIELIPQILKTIKLKSVKDISPIYFFMSCSAYVIYILANSVLENWPIVYSHIPGLCATIIMIGFLIKYRGK